MSFELFITRRYLRVGQKQAFISLISLLSIAGVAVGVMALIVVIAVMSGFEADLKTRLLAMQAHLTVTPADGREADAAAALRRLGRERGVRAAAVYLDSQVMWRSATAVAGARLRGVDAGQAAAVIDGRVDLAPLARSAQGPPAVVLGRELARQLGRASCRERV